MMSEDIIRPTAIVAGGGPSGALTAKVCAYHISVLFVSAIQNDNICFIYHDIIDWYNCKRILLRRSYTMILSISYAHNLIYCLQYYLKHHYASTL